MPNPDKKKYRSNFLDQVIYKITFNGLEAIDDELMKKLKDGLGDDYGELSSVKQQGIIIQNVGSDISADTQDTLVWQLKSVDGTHEVQITQDSFAITFRQYDKFRVYKEVIFKAQRSFLSMFDQIDQINRLGLRYVNVVKPAAKKVEWSDYIKAPLVDSLGFVEPAKVRRSMHNLVIAHDDDTQINFNYGVFNQYFPAPVVDNEFILDLDAYTPFPIEVSECEAITERFNAALAIYFELSITEKLREEMGVIDEQ